MLKLLRNKNCSLCKNEKRYFFQAGNSKGFSFFFNNMNVIRVSFQRFFLNSIDFSGPKKFCQSPSANIDNEKSLN